MQPIINNQFMCISDIVIAITKNTNLDISDLIDKQFEEYLLNLRNDIVKIDNNVFNDVTIIINEMTEDYLGYKVFDSKEAELLEKDNVKKVELLENDIDNNTELSENEIVIETDIEPPQITSLEIDKIFAPINKGGLSLVELLEKAEKYGLNINGITNKTNLKKLMQTLIKPTRANIGINDIEKMFAPISKGGLKLTELKESAKSLKINISGLTKKDDIKNAFLEHVGQEFITIDNSEESDDSKGQLECEFIFTKGPRKGDKCSTKPKNGESLCGKHKSCKNTPESSNNDSEDDTKNVHKKCLYVGTRGLNNGKTCESYCKNNDNFCSKHINSTQAINYIANESPSAKKLAKNDSDSEAENKPKIIRNAELKVWVVENGNLVVKSPKNPVVYGFISPDGILNNKITNVQRELAKEMGLLLLN